VIDSREEEDGGEGEEEEGERGGGGGEGEGQRDGAIEGGEEEDGGEGEEEEGERGGGVLRRERSQPQPHNTTPATAQYCCASSDVNSRARHRSVVPQIRNVMRPVGTGVLLRES